MNAREPKKWPDLLMNKFKISNFKKILINGFQDLMLFDSQEPFMTSFFDKNNPD